jgi:hypothetical protein
MVDNGFSWVNFCIVATKEKNKSHANATMVVLGYFCKFCHIFRDNCQKLSRLDIRFTKVINTKQDFEKKIYNPSKIEIFILGNFQSVMGFLFWVQPIIMAQSPKKRKKKNLNLKGIHPQCPSNSHTHIPWSFMLKNILIIFENYEN